MIVADAMMPKMDGFQLCKEVRALPSCSTLPFIIYTGNYVDATDQEFARSIGVDRYVVKYAGLGALVQAINELAQQRYGRKPEEPAPADRADRRSGVSGEAPRHRDQEARREDGGAGDVRRNADPEEPGDPGYRKTGTGRSSIMRASRSSSLDRETGKSA